DGALAACRRSVDRNHQVPRRREVRPPERRVVRCCLLRQGARFDRAISLWQGAPPNAGRSPRQTTFTGVEIDMVKREWGGKRTCPKCSTRFYALGKDAPVHCINCGTDFVPDP